MGVTSRTVQILSSSKLFHDPIFCLGTPLFCQLTDDFILQKSAGTHTEVWSLFHVLLSFGSSGPTPGRSERSKSLLVVLSGEDPLHRHQPGVGLARPSGDQPKLSAEMESSLKVSSVTGSLPRPLLIFLFQFCNYQY